MAAFAAAGAELHGDTPLSDLPRLKDSAVATDAMPAVRWHAAGERKVRVGAPDEIWLQLHAEVDLPLECQRCLAPVVTLDGTEEKARATSANVSMLPNCTASRLAKVH